MLRFNSYFSYMMMSSLLTSSTAIRDSFIRGAIATNNASSFLDAESLRRQELSIVSSLREGGTIHRSLQSNNCMQDLKGQTLSCTANDVEFETISGIEVYDEGAYLENGVWKDACRGIDDYVNLSFKAKVNLGPDNYDVGMYINTEGGHAYTGTCALALISQTDFQLGAVDPEVFQVGGNTVQIGEFETGADADKCPDFTNSGSGRTSLNDYPFAQIRLKCIDDDSDGLLDFSVAIAWRQNVGRWCSPDDVSTWPIPGTTSKCWTGPRFSVPVEVPPWNTPSSQPSVSSMPSGAPSVSAQPSSSPSQSPSSLPSSSPSISTQPSSQPTSIPSAVPSSSPSISAAPSDVPSASPSSKPSSQPSDQPSSLPSQSPSVSTKPTSTPSSSPSVSLQPSISSRPTHNTAYPSSSPSISMEPTESPTTSPSVSKSPSLSPTYAPSSMPSESPTGSLYYPDWLEDSQICKNDGADPEYMLQIQRDNYLYRSKEECCENHFWWRIQQCMGNEHPMYYSNGSYCDQKVYFEDWESKYTPGTWDASDQFETLRECCVAKFWYDVEGCIAASPKELTFSFTFELDNVITPMYCQDADIMGNALETAINIGLGSGSTSSVTGIGCATLSRNADTDNTECGGCLTGSYTGDFDGTYPAGYYTTTSSTTIYVDVSAKSAECTDSACLQALYSSIIANFGAFVSSGDLSTEITTWAVNRAPPIPELWNAEALTSSFSTSGDYTDPFDDPNGVISATSVTTTGSLSVSGIPTLSTSAQINEATAYFEAAITETLTDQGVFPDGATVTVTGISNGVVEYEITMNADSSTDATQAVSQINSSLSQPSTLTSITTAVQAESSGGTLSMASLSVNSNTAGTTTETELAKATSTGQLTTSIDTTGLSSAEVNEIGAYFEDALSNQLQSEGLLTEGSYITVTGITNGVVDYTITMFNDPSADVGSIAASIDSTLSQASTLMTIQDTVIKDSSGVIEGTSVTTTGTLSVSGLSITTSAELNEATAYFDAAITDTLMDQGVFPDGAIVTVTGFRNGVVEYEITMNADSSADATQAVSQINSSLNQSSTLTAIKDAAISESSSGTLSLTSLTVDYNTVGTSTEETVSKVTSSGQLTTSISTSGLTSAQIDEIAVFFEDSIARELDLLGVLPEGSYITVTGINNGAVDYTITMYNDPSADSSSIVSSIDSALTQTSTLSAIQTTVQSTSSGSSVATTLSSITISSFTAGNTTGIASSSSVTTALSTMAVTGFVSGETTGIPNTLWYPDFSDKKSGCLNNGYEPTYMKENQNFYLFSSKKECCEEWYSYDVQNCEASGSTDNKFFPNLSTGLCGMKQEKDFESWEKDRYDTLEECCSAKFSTYNFENCCSASGLGGCSTTGDVKYVPDWSTKSCVERSVSSLSPWEEIFASTSATACCTNSFGYLKNQCCKASGGCQ